MSANTVRSPMQVIYEQLRDHKARNMPHTLAQLELLHGSSSSAQSQNKDAADTSAVSHRGFSLTSSGT